MRGATQTPRHFAANLIKTVRLDYLLSLPQGYDEDPTQRWPLILFLHGAGARGEDVEQVRQFGLPQLVEGGLALPFVVVSPQCPAESHWTLHIDALNALLSDVVARYRVDEARLCLTGVSMGGAGAWFLAGASPERFAALVPVASRIVPLPLPRLKNLPVWVFHGEDDAVVPLSEARRTVDALRAVGASVKLTIYPDTGHQLDSRVYSDPTLYAWLLRRRRS